MRVSKRKKNANYASKRKLAQDIIHLYTDDYKNAICMNLCYLCRDSSGLCFKKYLLYTLMLSMEKTSNKKTPDRNNVRPGAYQIKLLNHFFLASSRALIRAYHASLSLTRS